MAVIDLLDEAEQLGIVESVEDDTGYWRHRGIGLMDAKMSEMNTLVAAVADQLRNQEGSTVIDDQEQTVNWGGDGF